MCGLSGFLTRKPQAQASQLLVKMGSAIRHRGPDDSGVWFDEKAGIGLSHCRLSILDLSSAGHQPMLSVSGRYAIVFNGEIYNHLDLREELQQGGRAMSWRGHSDTETLLAAFEAWGIETAVKKTVGMFAIAVWDRQEQELILVRDRLGEKPLYYGWQKDTFLFASELQAFRPHPDFNAAINRDALALLMRYQYVPAPFSIYEGISKLLPGTLLKVSLKKPLSQPQGYWDLKQVVENGSSRPFRGTPDEAVAELEIYLRRAIGRQMISDVPLGAFLSGGVDSSTIVALMQAASSRPVRTFTIGFNEEQYNEAAYAKEVARHLGTQHTELYVSPKQAMDVISLLPDLYSEPFSDSSQIPTFLVSQLARQHVTVSLSGDAGDELFAGYNRYIVGKCVWGKIAPLPSVFRRSMAAGIAKVSPSAWDKLLGPCQKLLPRGLVQAQIGQKMHKGAVVLAAKNPADLYRLLISHWSRPLDIVIGASEPMVPLMDPACHPKTDHFVQQMMAMDMMSYLPDDILCKVDRAAMGVSLESRVPFLDHQLVEFTWSLPLEYKLKQGVGKWPLRQVLYKYVPKELIERPKMGFGIPLDRWLHGPLRDWAEGLLVESRLRQEGYFYAQPIRQKWEEHLSGKRNWQHQLWNVLMFQAWLEKNT